MAVVDGQAVDVVPLDDRGLAYGDGVFETIRVLGGKPVLLDMHLARLELGCRRLGFSGENVRHHLTADLDKLGAAAVDDGVLKIVVTRGSGGRGYAPPASPEPRRILRLTAYVPLPGAAENGIATRVCLTRLAINPRIAGIKHLNRLEQVLASAELGDAVEGLMLDVEGNVVEGTKSNLFACLAGQWATPLVDRCGVAGVMREYLIDRTGADEVRLSINGLRAATELFVCNSVFGIIPVTRIDPGEGECLDFPVGESTRELQATIRSALGAL